MKKVVLGLIGFVLVALWGVSVFSADKVVNKANPIVQWDAVTVSGLPATSVVSYDYGYKLSPATIPTVIGNVSGLSATYALTTYGTYSFCARSVLKDQGVIVTTSEWGCSDVKDYCLGGVSFVDSFWPVMPIPRNLALP